MLLYIITNAVLFSFLVTSENIPQTMAAWITDSGLGPITFLLVVNMEVGMCHPPVGLNLYVASGITKMGITELTIAVMPWLLTMLGFLALVTYWPGLSLWLPNLIYN
jgi:C4-dicarboxylate transporter DctM subunit